MEFKYKKHTKIVVDLEVGEKVITDGWGPKLDGKIHTIEEIKLHPGCESAVMVKISGYDSFIDSGWLIKQ